MKGLKPTIQKTALLFDLCHRNGTRQKHLGVSLDVGLST